MDSTTPKRILAGIGLAILFVVAVLYGAFVCTPPRFLPLQAFLAIATFILALLGLTTWSWKISEVAKVRREAERAKAERDAAPPPPEPVPDGAHWTSGAIRNPAVPHPRTVQDDGPLVRKLLRQVTMRARPAGAIRTFTLAKRGPFTFGPSSERALATCHPDVVKVLRMAILYVDFTVLEGHRGEQAQNEAYAHGDSKLKYPCGNHNAIPSDAADVAPYPVDWSNAVNARDRFVYLAGIIMTCAAILNVPMRWGGDWDSDQDMRDEGSFRDFPHFERRNKDYSTIIRCP